VIDHSFDHAFSKGESNEGGIFVPRMGVIIVSDFEMYYKLENNEGGIFVPRMIVIIVSDFGYVL